jgi:predicted DCC family thiol-disulfide oxidoreductase YuxK
MSAKSALIYDGECAFCRIWLEYAQALLGDSVEWIPSREIGDRFPGIPRDEFARSVFFVSESGKVWRGAEAVCELLALSPRHKWLLWMYRSLPLASPLADLVYRYVARHRGLALTLTRITFGGAVRPLAYRITESLFLRLLGLTYLAAFASLRVQILGLIGSGGIVPAGQMMHAMRTALGARALLLEPTIFWINAGDGWLVWVCNLGIIASIALVVSGWLGQFSQRLSAFLCFGLYLSLTSAGQPFTLFQWDALLAEAGFLALFAGTPLAVWAFRLLTFRLMFESGCVKLLSGDPNWRNLHALRFHFITQPLPNPLAWYLCQAPGWVLDSLTFLALAIEILCPFLLFLPRRLRHVGAGVLIALQTGILLTGNYAFFNFLSIALCLWAFDDRSFRRLQPVLKRSTVAVRSALARKAATAVLSVVMLLGVLQIIELFSPAFVQPFRPVLSLIGPWEVVNSYGLFAVMTTSRPELIFEGSDDGKSWKEYSFPYKPGAVNRRLPIVAPHQPRLDWQLWFAALSGNYQADPWTGNLVVRLLQGRSSVLGLLDSSPFSKPPKFIRVSLYDYWFTTAAERRETGAIWNRRYNRPYLPPISLDMVQPGPGGS